MSCNTKILSHKEWMQKAENLFGKNKKNWSFKCMSCKKSTTLDENLDAYSLCKKCDPNWSANGLFHGPVLIIIDPEKSHNGALKINCSYVFDFGEEVQ